MQRRSFLAISAVGAATSSLGAAPMRSIVGSAPAEGSARFPSPRLVGLGVDADANRVRALPLLLDSLNCTERRLDRARVSIRPIADMPSRVAQGCALDIEMLYPSTGGSRSLLYSAHSAGVGSYPAGLSCDAHPNTAGKTTFIVTQRMGNRSRETPIRIDASRPGRYLLAIPTSPDARVPIWRATQIIHNEHNTPLRLHDMLGQRSKHCAMLSIEITAHENVDSSEGDDHAR